MATPDRHKGEKWVRAIRAGDVSAWEELVATYRVYLYHVAYKVLLNEDDALDVVQDVFATLVEKVSTYRGESTFRTWITTITIRKALDSSRNSHHRVVSIEDIPPTHESVAEFPSVQRDIERRQQLARVERAIPRLSPQQRAIVLLKLREAMSPTEIGVQLSLPAGQVRTQLFRALEKIRREVKKTQIGETDHG